MVDVRGKERILRAYTFDVVDRDQYRTWYADKQAVLEHRSPFHQPAWLAAASEGLGFTDVYVGIFHDGQMVGVVPGFLARRGPVRVFGSPLRGTMTSYLGPIGSDLPTDEESLIDLSRQAGEFVRRRFKVVYARFTLRSAPAEGTPDLGPSWRQQRPLSYRLDLTGGEEAVWDGLKSDCRRNIRRARRENIEVEPLDDPHLFYRMLDRTLRRHGSTSFHSERFFEILFSGLTVPQFRPLAAIYRGKAVAGGIFYGDDRELHYLSGASEPENGSLPTSYLLHWHALQLAMADGLSVFNSDASRVRSIDQFKESFRPTLERRHTMIWAPSPVYRAQKHLISGHRRLRRLRAKVSPGS